MTVTRVGVSPRGYDVLPGPFEAGLERICAAGRGGRLAKWMERDKKNRAGRTSLLLAHGIGRAFVEPAIDSQRLVEFL